ncbi:MAG: HTH domain-containing protein [Cytophagales bacterium]
MNFLELAEKVLTEANKPLSVSEIWDFALKKGFDKQLNSNGATPKATLSARLFTNIKELEKTIFSTIEKTTPKKFALKKIKYSIDAINETENEEILLSKPTKKVGYLEKDLHSLLTFFAHNYLKCYTKTINHSLSTKKEFGEWVHPDMVGCYFPVNEWKPEVFQLSSVVGNSSLKFFSFEIKRELSFANLRESFFQTVSNSSWANESYLVGAEISDDVEFQNTLKRLSVSFGIGVIQLDTKIPDDSKILFSAKNRENLDWDTINRLSEKNTSFFEFIKTIKIDFTANKIHTQEYDKVIDSDELVKILNQKKDLR